MGKGVKKKLKKQKRSASNKRTAQSTAAEQGMEQAAILRCSTFIGTRRFMICPFPSLILGRLYMEKDRVSRSGTSKNI